MVVIAILAIALILGSYFVFSSLNLAAVRVDRDQSTNQVLAKAKEALIAYAAADTNRPGELPCPDVNDDGKLVIGEDIIGSACASLTGRLPWVTLGLPDLRDDTGERLWYSLSNDFHANGSVALNSDTAYRTGNVSLTVTGTTPASNIVAVVFSPGAALQRSDGVAQARGCIVGTNCDATLKCTSVPASNTPKCNPANFLDIAAGEDNADANRVFVAAARSDSFNDRLMPVFSDEIMWLVEKRAARELAQYLRAHYDNWQSSTVVSGTNNGFYPYAVPFGDPATVAVGTNGTTSGMLPLANTPLTWSNASAECTGNGTATLDCSGLVVCLPIVGCALTPFSGRIDNVATRFVDPPSAANVQLIGLSLGGSATWTLNKAQRRLDFSWQSVLAAGVAHIQVSAPATSSWVNTSWVTANDWHQNAFYTLSSGYAIDATGAKSCGGVAPACVTISNTTAPNNDKEAVVVMTGRALGSAAQSTRPVAPTPVAITQFLEGANATATAPTFVFASGAKTATFNDYPVAVRP